MKTVSSAYARKHFAELLQDVSRGEKVVIERHKRSIAELGPPSISKSKRRIPTFGTGRDRIKSLDPHWTDRMTDDDAEAFIEGRY